MEHCEDRDGGNHHNDGAADGARGISDPGRDDIFGRQSVDNFMNLDLIDVSFVGSTQLTEPFGVKPPFDR